LIELLLLQFPISLRFLPQPKFYSIECKICHEVIASNLSFQIQNFFETHYHDKHIHETIVNPITTTTLSTYGGKIHFYCMYCKFQIEANRLDAETSEIFLQHHCEKRNRLREEYFAQQEAQEDDEDEILL
jgi:hypothetical protein